MKSTQEFYGKKSNLFIVIKTVKNDQMVFALRKSNVEDLRVARRFRIVALRQRVSFVFAETRLLRSTSCVSLVRTHSSVRRLECWN